MRPRLFAADNAPNSSAPMGNSQLQGGRGFSPRITAPVIARAGVEVLLQGGRGFSPRITHAETGADRSEIGFNEAAAFRRG